MKIEKVEKLVARFFDKNELVIHIRNFKQALNHGLVLKKVHRVIESQQKEEETVWCQDQITILHFFQRKFAGYRNEKKLKYTWINMSI